MDPRTRIEDPALCKVARSLGFGKLGRYMGTMSYGFLPEEIAAAQAKLAAYEYTRDPAVVEAQDVVYRNRLRAKLTRLRADPLREARRAQKIAAHAATLIREGNHSEGEAWARARDCYRSAP